jgi:hypothetical protein
MLTILSDRRRFAAADASSAPLQDQIDALRQQLITSKMEAEARNAGMIDPDCCRMADLSGVSLQPDGRIAGHVEAIAKLRQDRPYLFKPGAAAAAADSPTRVDALDLSDDDYKALKAKVLSSSRRGGRPGR